MTWAFLSAQAEAKIMNGEMLLPAEWRSGDRMWVIEIIAPYGQGTAAHVVRWLKRSLPENINRLRYLRSHSDNALKRIVEMKRLKNTQWGTRLVNASAVTP